MLLNASRLVGHLDGFTIPMNLFAANAMKKDKDKHLEVDSGTSSLTGVVQ
jgi:hypothetical protein